MFSLANHFCASQHDVHCSPNLHRRQAVTSRKTPITSPLHKDRCRLSYSPAHISCCTGFLGAWCPCPPLQPWTCGHARWGSTPSRGRCPRSPPLFLPLPEAQNVTENAPANGMLRPEEECLAPRTAGARLYCYLFHAGVISECPATHHSVICCFVSPRHERSVISQPVERAQLSGTLYKITAMHVRKQDGCPSNAEL